MRVLHIAPEQCFERRFRKAIHGEYLTADLFRSDVNDRVDVSNMRYAAESFDVIFCSHVLEHVPDDTNAIREFFRVLKRGGWAVLNVPITSDVTFENPSITDPDERLRIFGQKDHVRRYGPDYIDRLRACGFRVNVYGVADLIANDEARRYGLSYADDKVYYCMK